MWSYVTVWNYFDRLEYSPCGEGGGGGGGGGAGAADRRAGAEGVEEEENKKEGNGKKKLRKDGSPAFDVEFLEVKGGLGE